MRIGRIRKHTNTIELTLVLTREDCRNLTHTISCNERCVYPDKRKAGAELLQDIDDKVLTGFWPVQR